MFPFHVLRSCRRVHSGGSIWAVSEQQNCPFPYSKRSGAPFSPAMRCAHEIHLQISWKGWEFGAWCSIASISDESRARPEEIDFVFVELIFALLQNYARVLCWNGTRSFMPLRGWAALWGLFPTGKVLESCQQSSYFLSFLSFSSVASTERVVHFEHVSLQNLGTSLPAFKKTHESNAQS